MSNKNRDFSIITGIGRALMSILTGRASEDDVDFDVSENWAHNDFPESSHQRDRSTLDSPRIEPRPSNASAERSRPRSCRCRGQRPERSDLATTPTSGSAGGQAARAGFRSARGEIEKAQTAVGAAEQEPVAVRVVGEGRDRAADAEQAVGRLANRIVSVDGENRGRHLGVGLHALLQR